jgi:tetratricopeptide (TPR) repeat protein
MLRIFVGCTSVDLKRHRHAARRLIEKFDEHAVVMEDFGAQDGDATQVSLAELASADVYILLLAWRYGTIPAEETRSVTHLEYRAAKDAGMPRLIFLADPATERDDGPDALFPAAIRDDEHAAQVRAFREEVGHDRVAATFTTPESAALEVAVALHRFLRARAPNQPSPPVKLAPRAPEFVGRTSELADLCQRLRSGQSVGLSALVAGLGGIGKSALAAEALVALAAEPDAFPGGVTWVRCDGREGHDGLTWLYDQLLADWGAPLSSEQLAQTQTISREAEVELRERALQNCLRASTSVGQPLPPALVLLDNVEVGLPMARALDTLMSLGITALVTARHQPSVARLAVVRLDVLDPTAAVQLFTERYREKGGAWDDARDSDAAATIVERLGWLPLAIELQAARAALRGMSVTQVSSDLARDRSQGLLGDPLDATRNMRYSFAQSLRTLTPLQCIRFAALGLPGGSDWPRSVIVRLLASIQENTASGAPNEEPSASELAAAQADLDLLAALSLIYPVEGRIRLHPLLRDYAHELWQDKPHETQAQGLSSLLAGIFDLVTTHRGDFAALTIEIELIVSAIAQAYSGRIALHRLITIVNSLTNYVIFGGQWHLGSHLFHWQLEICREMGDRSGEGTTLNNLGELARRLGHPEQAKHYYEQALVIAREVDNRSSEGATLNNLGSLAKLLGQPEQAQRYFEESLIISRTLKDLSNECSILNNLGLLLRSLGQPEEARTCYEQALAISRTLGDLNGEGSILNNLGRLASDNGQLEEAQRYYGQAFAIHHEIGNHAWEAANLNNLGQIAYKLGRLEEARQYYEQALVNAKDVGYREVEGGILNNLGQLALKVGHMEEAERYFEQALIIRREVGDRSGEARTLSNLGGLSYIQGQSEQAREYIEQALAIAQEIGEVELVRVFTRNVAYFESHKMPDGDIPDEYSDKLPE